MRNLIVTLIIAVIFMVIALAGTVIGALGIALIGLLLHRWFDLTQWQGSLIALAIASGLAFLIVRLSLIPAPEPHWVDTWEEEEEEEEEEQAEEPPIVPWRRSRPTPGELPSDKPAGTGSKSAASPKTRNRK